jgi:hypothetical protein
MIKLIVGENHTHKKLIYNSFYDYIIVSQILIVSSVTTLVISIIILITNYINTKTGKIVFILPVFIFILNYFIRPMFTGLLHF